MHIDSSSDTSLTSEHLFIVSQRSHKQEPEVKRTALWASGATKPRSAPAFPATGEEKAVREEQAYAREDADQTMKGELDHVTILRATIYRLHITDVHLSIVANHTVTIYGLHTTDAHRGILVKHTVIALIYVACHM